MSNLPYRVGEGANLALYPRGTKVGDIVLLSESAALYERDMGRLTAVEGAAEKEAPSSAKPEALTAAEAVSEALPAIDDAAQKLRKSR